MLYIYTQVKSEVFVDIFKTGERIFDKTSITLYNMILTLHRICKKIKSL